MYMCTRKNKTVAGATLRRHVCICPGMPLGLFKKVGKYPGTGGLGAEPPAGSRGRVRPLEARAFSQSELPRKPPIDTHGRYTYNTCTRGKKEEKKKKKKKKLEGLKKSEKLHPCMSCIRVHVDIFA